MTSGDGSQPLSPRRPLLVAADRLRRLAGMAVRGRVATTVPWLVQIVLNLAWSVIFFGLRRPGWALAEIVVLAAAIAWTIRAMRPVDKRAAALMVPYLAWVGFAIALNAAIVWLNR